MSATRGSTPTTKDKATAALDELANDVEYIRNNIAYTSAKEALGVLGNERDQLLAEVARLREVAKETVAYLESQDELAKLIAGPKILGLARAASEKE